MGLGVWEGEEILGLNTGHGERDSRNMMKDTPKGALGSLSPQKHPIGLDHHLYSNLWDEIDGIPHGDFQVSGADTARGGRVLNEATDCWNYSNCTLYEQAQEGLLPQQISLT